VNRSDGPAAVLDGDVRREDAAHRWTGASGSPGFVRAARRAARSVGVRRVHQDRFLGA